VLLCIPGREGGGAKKQTHRLCNVHIQLAGGVVVQEEEGFGAGGDDVVHAHGHQVDAYGVVLAHVECQLQLGAHPVRARNQEGVTCTAGSYLNRMNVLLVSRGAKTFDSLLLDWIPPACLRSSA